MGFRKIIFLTLTFACAVVYSILVIFKLLFNWITTLMWNPWTASERKVPPKCITEPEVGTHKYIKLENIKLHYVEAGDKSNTLMLFLHGFPEFWYSWRYQLKEFSKDYWTVAVDMRGYGDSDKPAAVAQYDIKYLVQDIKNLVTALAFEFDKATHLGDLRALLNGKSLRIATLQNFPLNYAVQENGTWVGKGVAFTFVNVLQEKFNFSYTVVLPKENILGSQSDGIFGLLNNGEADFAAAFLPVLSYARDFIRYSTNLDSGEWVVLMKRPKESASGNGLLAPFTLHVWMLILLSLIAVGPIIYLLILLRWKLCKDKKNIVFPLPSCVWFVYGALLKQGSTLSPISDSSRLLFATWWIFITILTAFYTANLTAYLTLSRFALPIEKAMDIVTKKYNWAAQKGQAIESAIIRPQEELNYFDQRFGQFLSDEDNVILQSWVHDKNYMYMRDKPGVEYLMYNDYLQKTRQGIDEAKRCTYVITKWPVLIRPRAFAYAMNFTWRDLFNPVLRSIVESGIVKHLTRIDLPGTEICPKNLGGSGRQMQNSDLFTTYMVVLIGFAIAAVAFIGEVIARHWRSICGLKPSSSERAKSAKMKNGFESNFFPQAPPSYQTLFKPPFSNSYKGKQQIINGRDYWVVTSKDGETRLIPVRTPSALLFHYT